MTARRATKTVVAVLVSLFSLGASIASGVFQQQQSTLLTTEVPAQLAPISVAAVPTGMALPPPSAPLTVAQRRLVARGLWSNPLDGRLVNLLYANSMRTGVAVETTDREADLLSRLGWHFSPTQVNLIIRAAQNEQFSSVVDHADALLRQQMIPALGYATLQAMEGVPQIHDYLVAKLRKVPPWRQDYLAAISPQSPQSLLLARIRTLDILMRTSRGISREEMAPSLVALAGSGHGPEAYQLWRRHVGSFQGGNLIYDPSFQEAAGVLAMPGLAIPFEWRFGQGVGYAAGPSSGGVAIDWDRHGIPTFLSQLVPVMPGRTYVLTIKGTSQGSTTLSTLLAPQINCADITVRPDAVTTKGDVRYAFPPLPRECRMGQLTINGALDAGTGNVSLTVAGVALQQIP